MSKVNSKWKYTYNVVNGQQSRILLLWDSTQWSNIILHSSEQYMSCILHNTAGVSMLCTIVYAHNDEGKRTDLWNYLEEQSTKFNLPGL